MLACDCGDSEMEGNHTDWRSASTGLAAGQVTWLLDLGAELVD